MDAKADNVNDCWRVEQNEQYPKWFCVYEGDAHLACCYGESIARTLAAAPELLEALETLVKHNDALCAASGQFSTADAVGYQRNEKARAAITKARGESK